MLGVPVFFDTVFYLLVPLARSLYRRTGGHYLLYILAIGAGGAITHTLVPPTPGPLAMAAELKVDLGWMIMIGAGGGDTVGDCGAVHREAARPPNADSDAEPFERAGARAPGRPRAARLVRVRFAGDRCPCC